MPQDLCLRSGLRVAGEIETEARAGVGVDRLTGDLKRASTVVVLVRRVVAALVDVREVRRFDRDVREEGGDLALVLDVVAAAHETAETVGGERFAEARVRVSGKRHPTLKGRREHRFERSL